MQANPALNQIEPDVEALLVNRVGQTRGSGIRVKDEVKLGFDIVARKQE